MSFVSFFVSHSSAQAQYREAEEFLTKEKFYSQSSNVSFDVEIKNKGNHDNLSIENKERFLQSDSFNSTDNEVMTVYDLICVDNPVLRVIQLSNVMKDSKEFVDRPLLSSPAEIWKAFKELPDYYNETIINFLDTYFGPVDTDLVHWYPPDVPTLQLDKSNNNNNNNNEIFKSKSNNSFTESPLLNSSQVESSKNIRHSQTNSNLMHSDSLLMLPSIVFESFSSMFFNNHNVTNNKNASNSSLTSSNTVLSSPVSIEKLNDKDIFLLQKAYHLWNVLGRICKDCYSIKAPIPKSLSSKDRYTFSYEEEKEEINKCIRYDVIHRKPFNITKVLNNLFCMESKRNTFIDVPYGFIVPGGRFREAYYWDSYWILRGLLISRMYETAKGMIRNFCYLIEKFGFVPNGLRLYYLDRSQPPVLSLMVNDYVLATKDFHFVAEVYSTVEKEYNFWMDVKKRCVVFAYDKYSDTFKSISYEESDGFNGRKIVNENDTIDTNDEKSNHNANIADLKLEKKDSELNATCTNEIYVLNRYGSFSYDPRPESYREDYYLSSYFSTKEKKKEILNAVRTSAESGWDFSSRWFNFELKNKQSNIDANRLKNRGNMVYLDTTNVLPIDLNTIIFGLEMNLANWAIIKYINYPRLARLKYNKYATAAQRRKFIMKKLMYNKEKAMWFDYLLKEERQSNVVSAASIWPLFIRLEDDEKQEEYERSIKTFVYNSSLWGSYGLMSTNVNTGEQWDYQNSWPPLLHMAVRVVLLSENKELRKNGIVMCENFLSSVFQGTFSYGVFFEKYNSDTKGKGGDGGEYDVQVGFGWTIATVIEFLKYKSVDYSLNGILNVFNADI